MFQQNESMEIIYYFKAMESFQYTEFLKPNFFWVSLRSID